MEQAEYFFAITAIGLIIVALIQNNQINKLEDRVDDLEDNVVTKHE